MITKDHTRTWLHILLVAAVLNMIIGVFIGKTFAPEPKPCPLPSIIDIQRAVGAEPDGIVGPETISKWEIAYANQEAKQFMTPSGGPRKDK